MTPEIFTLETVLGCDLKCPDCAMGGNLITRKKGHIKFDDFKIIADKIKPFCKYLYLHLWGEPMLNKDIFKMIKYASTFTRTNISTNGNSLSEEKAKRLIASGVTSIIVSIDGVTQEVYQKYRVGGDVVKAIKALRLLQHYNCRAGDRVDISPQFLVMEHNKHESNNFIKLCESLGLVPVFKLPYTRREKFLFDAKEAMKCKTVKENVFNILLDGSVVACCNDYNRFTNFGNIYNRDVMDIWNSLTFRIFRERVISGKAPQFCVERCVTYGKIKS